MSEEPVRLGWWLSSEEHDPRELVRSAARAEAAGITTAMISDHLQPWAVAQGHAGHVWTVLGAIADATEHLELGTGVTAMLHRSHPIDVAHAAATASVLFEGRFFLGVGTGERLNEQAYGTVWPGPRQRRAALREAIAVIRELWGGDIVIHDGEHWNVDHLRLFDRPAAFPAIYVASSGPRSAQLAGEVGDGMIAVTPNARLVDSYRGAGGTGPRLAQLHVSLADTVDAALDNAWAWWPNGAVAPTVLSELARPTDFQEIASRTRREVMLDTVICARDATPIVTAIGRFAAAGFDSVYLHQIGPDQQRLLDLIRCELLPQFGGAR